MIKYKTFLEAKNTTSYIDHNDKKQIVNLGGYVLEEGGHYTTRNEYNKIHSIDGLPALIKFKRFHWYENGTLSRDNNLPSFISTTNVVRNMIWRIGGKHDRTNGPAWIRKHENGTIMVLDFMVGGSKISEKDYVNLFQDNIAKRIREYPSDIQYYKIPNFEFQKTALDKDPLVLAFIKEFHPDLSKIPKYAHLVTAGSVGLFDA